MGHHGRGRAHGVRQRLPGRPGARLRRVRTQRGRGLAGADERAGGRRARGPAHPPGEGRPRRGAGRGDAREAGEPGDRALAAHLLRRSHVEHRHPRRVPGLRRDPQRGGERGPLALGRGLRRAPPRRLPGRPAAPAAVRRPAGGGGDDAHQRRALPGRRRDGREAAVQQLLHQRRRVRVHPVHRRRRRVGRTLRERPRLLRAEPALRGQGDRAGAGDDRQAPALRPHRQARAADVRPRGVPADHRRHHHRAAGAAGVHRGADARHRRGRA